MPAKGSKPLNNVNNKHIEINHVISKVNTSDINSSNTAKTLTIRQNLKRKHDEIVTDSNNKRKKKMQKSKSPIRFRWNNNSCAFDALLLILGHTINSSSIQ